MPDTLSGDVLFLVLILLLPVAALLGWLLGHLRAQRRLAALAGEKTRLETQLELERRNAEEKLQALTEARAQLADTFSALSQEALKHNTEHFLKLAQENLKRFHEQARSQLSEKEKAVEHLVRPIREALEKTEAQIRAMEKERKEAYGALHKHLETMAETQRSLQDETRQLVQALSRPEVRGQWGELTLKRLAELAGMVEHCDFYPQEHVRGEDGAVRPDMVVRMPDRRDIVVDAKTPLDAYLKALGETDGEARQRHLQAHARQVRERIRELASKSYWSQFKQAPDFVVLFIPGDQFLAAALDQDHELLEYALRQKVMLATPTSLVALLRAIAYGWRQEQLAENAEHIRQVGEELYARLLAFTEHLTKVGRSIESTVRNYNAAVGSFERRILPGARRFGELGVHADKPLPEPDQVEQTPRALDTSRDDPAKQDG